MTLSMGEKNRGCFMRLCARCVLLLLLAVLDVALTLDPISAALESLWLDTSRSEYAVGYRLPTDVYPLHYDLEIQPQMESSDPSDFTYKGSVKITVRCDNKTKTLVLHLNGPKVDPDSITYYVKGSDIRYDYVYFEVDPERQFLIIRLDEYLQVGKQYTIEMKFTSPLKNESVGFFYSSYRSDNKDIYLAATQFHPIHARNAFPCFDEPAMKATFTVTIIRPPHGVSLSNMPIASSVNVTLDNGTTYTKEVFKTTPKMSTFALAFAVCDYEFETNTSKNSVELKIWNKRKYLNATRLSLANGIVVNTHFANIFGERYLLEKKDIVAISEFEAAPSWGLHFYKESRLLYNQRDNTQEDAVRVARMISYGICQEWFGSLVTPSWWSDVWLKEGLAGYYEQIGVSRIFISMNTYDYVIIDKLHEALLHDGGFNSHPVYRNVDKPSAIKDMFDWVSSRKAPSLVKMMHSFLGHDIFYEAIRNYIKTYAYMSATSEDFLNVVTEAANNNSLDIDVKDIMATWLLQAGYPVVTVARDFNNHSILHVTQDRFLADPTARDLGTNVSPFNYRWSIPLTFTSSKNPTFDQNFTDVHWMYKEQHTEEIYMTSGLPACSGTDDWILANIRFYGYYRVNYQSGNWLALSRQLLTNHLAIQFRNRAQIINDAWNLAKAGYIRLNIALETVEYLHNERQYLPWYTAWVELRYTDSMLSYTSLYGAFQTFMRKKLLSPLKYYGLIPVGLRPLDISPWSLVAALACHYGIEECVIKARQAYQELMSNSSNSTISPYMRKAFYCQAIASGGWDEWKFALEMYKNTDCAAVKEGIIIAMACTKQPWILKYFLHILLEEDSLCRDRRACGIIARVGMNPKGRHLAWDFYRANYKSLTTKYPDLTCSKALPEIVQFFNTKLELMEATKFWSEKCSEFDETAFRLQIFDKIKSNINFMDRNIPVIKAWMADKGYLAE